MTRGRIMSAGLVAVAVAVAVAVVASSAMFLTREPAPSIRLTPVASGLEMPVDMVMWDGAWLVAERRGLVKRIGDSEPVLDIRDEVSTGNWEQGLLGIAADDLNLYAYYTDLDDNSLLVAHPWDGQRRKVLARFEQGDVIHNGGGLLFGPDGYLYLGLGDGGPPWDENRTAQDTSSPLGSILRIDVSDGTAQPPFDNPFVDDPGHHPLIWAYGLRNPWRFSFDRVTGDLYVGDVGQEHREEIDRLPAGVGGLNFGWSILEGTRCLIHGDRDPADCDPDAYEAPLAEYAHRDDGCSSVTGGFVYRGERHAALYGQYIYADFCSGAVWTLDVDQEGSSPRLAYDSDLAISSFGEDSDGELYALDYGTGTLFLIESD